MNQLQNAAAQHPPHGQIGYLQLPAVDIAGSAAFYASVFGWSADPASGSFESPGMIGQWTTDRSPAGSGGPVVWICADTLYPTLALVADGGGSTSWDCGATTVARTTNGSSPTGCWYCNSISPRSNTTTG
jgi:predicted enzyme related to lactoylglutathione lyase